MSKKQLVTSLLVLVTVACLIAATFYFYLSGMRKAVQVPETVPPTEVAKSPEILGQLFMVGHWANTPVASTTELIKKYGIGGVIIMSAPEDANEIKAWTKEWRAASAFPLFIAIDQEGGPVSRLKDDNFTQTGQREIYDIETAYAVGKKRGEELAALGINMNFAPVLDTAKNPDSFMYERVFKNQNESALLADAMVRGMSESGVIAVPKHFPGHDDTNVDSHKELPSVDISKAELQNFTTPFRTLIKEYPPAAMMTAHVLFPKVDDVPATLSHFFLTDYLRGELGFEGLIITDDMSMDAIDSNWGMAEATTKALEAGADMVLFAAEPAVIESVFSDVRNTTSSSTVVQRKKNVASLRSLLPAQQ